MELTELLNWANLATYSGAMAVTVLLTQLLKGMLDKIIYIPTRFLAYIVAFLVLLCAHIFTGALTASAFLLCIVNAAIVATSASGTVDAVRSLS